MSVVGTTNRRVVCVSVYSPSGRLVFNGPVLGDLPGWDDIEDAMGCYFNRVPLDGGTVIKRGGPGDLSLVLERDGNLRYIRFQYDYDQRRTDTTRVFYREYAMDGTLKFDGPIYHSGVSVCGMSEEYIAKGMESFGQRFGRQAVLLGRDWRDMSLYSGARDGRRLGQLYWREEA